RWTKSIAVTAGASSSKSVGGAFSVGGGNGSDWSRLGEESSAAPIAISTERSRTQNGAALLLRATDHSLVSLGTASAPRYTTRTRDLLLSGQQSSPIFARPHRSLAFEPFCSSSRFS